ncbi:hypothetical protein K1X76_05575 [bacterium]|nr:hypothetical protein [bacterium]
MWKKTTALLFLIFCSSCATNIASNLECARSEINNSNFDEAITCAQNVLEDDPGHIEATSLLASAYAGRSGIDFTALAVALLDLDSSDETNFQLVTDTLPEDADLSDLRLAIETLENLSGITESSLPEESDLADAAFNLGMLKAAEHFLLGIYESDYFATFDVTLISDDARILAQEDLIDFDTLLVNSGISEGESFIEEIRQTYCILEPISAGEGFTQEEFQALVGCQLSDNPETFDTTLLTADIVNCSQLDPDSQTPDVTDCINNDTTL